MAHLHHVEEYMIEIIELLLIMFLLEQSFIKTGRNYKKKEIEMAYEVTDIIDISDQYLSDYDKRTFGF